MTLSITWISMKCAIMLGFIWKYDANKTRFEFKTQMILSISLWIDLCGQQSAKLYKYQLFHFSKNWARPYFVANKKQYCYGNHYTSMINLPLQRTVHIIFSKSLWRKYSLLLAFVTMPFIIINVNSYFWWSLSNKGWNTHCV